MCCEISGLLLPLTPPPTDLLFVDCLKLAFDLLPADHPHKESFLKFMLEVRACTRRALVTSHITHHTSRITHHASRMTHHTNPLACPQVKAPAFRAQAADQLSKARSNLVMIHSEAGGCCCLCLCWGAVVHVWLCLLSLLVLALIYIELTRPLRHKAISITSKPSPAAAAHLHSTSVSLKIQKTKQNTKKTQQNTKHNTKQN